MKRSPVRKKRPGPPRRGPAGIDPERWRNPGYLKFLREEGVCEACWPRTFLPCDPCHGPANGMASKGPDAEAVPLDRVHHEMQHKLGWPAFEELYGFSREKEAAKWWARYQETP